MSFTIIAMIATIMHLCFSVVPEPLLPPPQVLPTSDAFSSGWNTSVNTCVNTSVDTSVNKCVNTSVDTSVNTSGNTSGNVGVIYLDDIFISNDDNGYGHKNRCTKMMQIRQA